MTARKNPITVQTIQWTGDNRGAVREFVGEPPAKMFSDEGKLYITKSGVWSAPLAVGTWIIAERDGNGFYPCTAEEFEATYKVVAE